MKWAQIDSTFLVMRTSARTPCERCGRSGPYDHTVMVMADDGQILWVHPLDVVLYTARIGGKG